MSTSAVQKKSFFINDPNIKINVSTRERKELMLGDDMTFIHHASLYDIKFKNLGGGVWEMFSEKRQYKTPTP